MTINEMTQVVYAAKDEIARLRASNAELLAALTRNVALLQDEHRKYHGEVFVYDEPKACCEMGNTIVQGLSAIRKAKGDL